MQTLRDIRHRIKSIRNTRQIARAMEMVSAARLRRAQGRLLSARPYAQSMDTIVQRVISGISSFDSIENTHSFLQKRTVRSVAICVLSSDRGLCGAFNLNVIRRAEELEAELRIPRVSREEECAHPAVEAGAAEAGGEDVPGTGPRTIHFIPIGKKAVSYFRKKKVEVLSSFPQTGSVADLGLAKTVADNLMYLYNQETVDEVWLVFTHFVSSGTRHVVAQRLLPIEFDVSAHAEASLLYIIEPPPEEFLHTLLPRYIRMRVFMAIAESSASEHSARMVAMTFATKSADDMVYSLTLLANRARQSAITKEIADIVGTAEVLK